MNRWVQTLIGSPVTCDMWHGKLGPSSPCCKARSPPGLIHMTSYHAHMCLQHEQTVYLREPLSNTWNHKTTRVYNMSKQFTYGNSSQTREVTRLHVCGMPRSLVVTICNVVSVNLFHSIAAWANSLLTGPPLKHVKTQVWNEHFFFFFKA